MDINYIEKVYNNINSLFKSYDFLDDGNKSVTILFQIYQQSKELPIDDRMNCIYQVCYYLWFSFGNYKDTVRIISEAHQLARSNWDLVKDNNEYQGVVLLEIYIAINVPIALEKIKTLMVNATRIIRNKSSLLYLESYLYWQKYDYNSALLKAQESYVNYNNDKNIILASKIDVMYLLAQCHIKTSDIKSAEKVLDAINEEQYELDAVMSASSIIKARLQNIKDPYSYKPFDVLYSYLDGKNVSADSLREAFEINLNLRYPYYTFLDHDFRQVLNANIKLYSSNENKTLIDKYNCYKMIADYHAKRFYAIKKSNKKKRFDKERELNLSFKFYNLAMSLAQRIDVLLESTVRRDEILHRINYLKNSDIGVWGYALGVDEAKLADKSRKKNVMLGLFFILFLCFLIFISLLMMPQLVDNIIDKFAQIGEMFSNGHIIRKGSAYGFYTLKESLLFIMGENQSNGSLIKVISLIACVILITNIINILVSKFKKKYVFVLMYVSYFVTALPIFLGSASYHFSYHLYACILGGVLVDVCRYIVKVLQKKISLEVFIFNVLNSVVYSIPSVFNLIFIYYLNLAASPYMQWLICITMISHFITMKLIFASKYKHALFMLFLPVIMWISLADSVYFISFGH